MKIAALVSGGVDSAVALSLILDEYKNSEITAYYLKIWLEDEVAFLGDCPWEEDLSFVKKICELKKIPLEIVSLQGEYWQKVVDTTIAELKKGYTPSPDILCNNRIKFGAFVDKLDQKFDKILTGHYASIKEEDGECHLLQGVDPIKDQSYFLSGLSQEQLKKCLFPLGKYQKSEVRELAIKYSLPNANRKDSQGICFLGKIKYADFVEAYLGKKPGNILEWETKKKLGNHDGYWFHTIGQRKGLGLSGGPWFVVHKDVKNNIVFVSKNDLSQDLTLKTFEVEDFSWNAKEPVLKEGDFLFKTKIRHGPNKIDAKIEKMEKGFRVYLRLPEKGVAPGQYAVLYQNERCLGSGVISKGLSD